MTLGIGATICGRYGRKAMKYRIGGSGGLRNGVDSYRYVDDIQSQSPFYDELPSHR
jgi:hypothetical protein